MNDLKTNNCPPNVFRNNYTHIGLYTDLWKLFNNSDHPLIKHSYLTMALIKAGLDAKTNLQKLFKKGVERRISHFNPHRRDWEIYGTDIKSAAPFRQNLENILRLAKSRHQKVLLVSFPYRIPDDYSLEKFRTGSLGYALDHTGLAKPLEVWGNRESIQKGILVHNQIILELAQKYACFYIDQHNLLQSDARYFIDPCHFSDAGISQFEENIYRFFYDKDLLASPN
jgi:hypothetical protein